MRDVSPGDSGEGECFDLSVLRGEDTALSTVAAAFVVPDRCTADLRILDAIASLGGEVLWRSTAGADCRRLGSDVASCVTLLGV